MYIAERNPETGRFEIRVSKDGRPVDNHGGDALCHYTIAVKLRGTENVLLLRDMYPQVSVKAEMEWFDWIYSAENGVVTHIETIGGNDEPEADVGEGNGVGDPEE